MTISLVVAASTNNAIGKDNQLLWHLPKDMKFFKNTTWALPVIMGRKTFESMGAKALPGRKNIVITSQADWKVNGVFTAGSLDEALKLAEGMDVKEVFVIGGGEIYKQAFEKANRIYMTRVHAEVEANVFFPAIESSEWTLLKNTDNPADEKHAFAYSFQVWERRRNTE